MDKSFIQTPTESIVTNYHKPIEYADRQLEILWLPGEINVEKDVQSILVDMTPSEKHGVLTTLRLFTLYELKAGNEYWNGRFRDILPRPEFQRMASVFGMFESAVHAPFYNKLNEALNVATDEFYLDYVNDPDLKARMEFIDEALSDPDELFSLGVFSMIEGAVLYSSFAFLKHFQANGKNKINNVVRGIAFSVRDESLHAEAGAWCFKTLKKEAKLTSPNDRLKQAARVIYEHECLIIDKVFSQGEISGITPEALKAFVAHRVNLCLKNLGLGYAVIEHLDESVANWFYKDTVGYVSNDFFAGVGKEYKRNWNESAFTW